MRGTRVVVSREWFAYSEVELFDEGLENVFGVGVQREQLHLAREVEKQIVVCSAPKRRGALKQAPLQRFKKTRKPRILTT